MSKGENSRLTSYPYAYGCGPSKWRVEKYWKYKNPDPSTQKHAPIIAAELLAIIEEKISEDIKRIYHIRPESILGTDLRHAVIRELTYLLNKEVLKIDRFEQENSGDIRNYHEGEGEQK
jgi:hypothetical protein